MEHAVTAGGLAVRPALLWFVVEEALPGTGIEPSDFWAGLGSIVEDFGPRNAELLRDRDRLQAQIDDWHRLHCAGRDAEEGLVSG